MSRLTVGPPSLILGMSFGKELCAYCVPLGTTPGKVNHRGRTAEARCPREKGQFPTISLGPTVSLPAATIGKERD